MEDLSAQMVNYHKQDANDFLFRLKYYLNRLNNTVSRCLWKMLGISMNAWIKQTGKILIQDFQAKRILSLKSEQICIVLGQDRREGHIGWNSKLKQLKRVNHTWKVISVNKSRGFLKGKKCSWKRTLSKKKQLCQRVIHKRHSFAGINVTGDLG